MAEWFVDVEAPDGRAGDRMQVSTDSEESARELGLAEHVLRYGEAGWVVVNVEPATEDDGVIRIKDSRD